MNELLEKLENVDYEITHFTDGGESVDEHGFYWSLNGGQTGGYAETMEEALKYILEAAQSKEVRSDNRRQA